MEDKQDLVGRYNIVSRVLLLSLAFVYVWSGLGTEESVTKDGVTIITTIFNEPVISTTGFFVVLGLGFIVLGINGITKLTGLIKAWKSK